MKNVVFISPNFPTNYWKFCRGLKNDGVNVLGVGDQPYNELSRELKENLNEYYKVNNLENYEEVYKAVAFFSFKYGHIDWIESNNEYWLENDAALRDDFNVQSGFKTVDMPRIRCKSRMKEFYAKAGIPAARWHIVDDEAGCLRFIDEVGYPVCVKPDNGVGASDTHKLSNDEELREFLAKKTEGVPYIMEEFVYAEVNSYDAIVNSHGEPIFETGNVTPNSVMDIVNNGDSCIYYIVKDLPDDVRKAGRAALKAFGVRSRFIHFEFFRLTKDMEGLGKDGDVIALEVNMRPCGGFSPDMMNYANGTDVYQIWADMIAHDSSTIPEHEHGFCAFAGRRDGKNYVMDHNAIIARYGPNIRMSERLPDAIADAMGNQMYIGLFKTEDEMNTFYKDILEVR